MILLADGPSSDAVRNVLLGISTTVITAAVVWIGRKATKLIDRISNVIAVVEPQEPKIDYRTDPDTGQRTPIVVDRGRPGVQGQIADLRASLDGLREELAAAGHEIHKLADVPAQLAENRDVFEQRLIEADRLQRQMIALAADSARDASNADQRVAELAELVGAQIESLHMENQALRSSLHEIGLDTDIPKPGDHR